jgi:mono/diheme cytochrome c family protein
MVIRSGPRFHVMALLWTGIVLAGCREVQGTEPPRSGTAGAAAVTTPGALNSLAGLRETSTTTGSGMPMMAGSGHSAMMQMHQQPVPADYQGQTHPSEPDEAALARGRTTYDTYCALCHGATGQGDGPAGASLDPPPAPVAMSSVRMGDDYLFWRISEGGLHFKTGMPVWKAALSESERWDVIHYMRSLGAAPAPAGAGSNAQVSMDRLHDAMLQEAQSRGLITPADATLFRRVHPFVDRFNQEQGAMMAVAGAEKKARQRTSAAQAVSAGLISQSDADEFTRVHDILVDAGIMP